MMGDPQGASGAAGVVATALALSEGFLPDDQPHRSDPDAIWIFCPTKAAPRGRKRRYATAWDRVEEVGARARSGLRPRVGASWSRRGGAASGLPAHVFVKARGRSAARRARVRS